MVDVLQLNATPFTSANMFRRMAALAFQTSVLAFEGITSLRVIETGGGWCPTNQGEVFSVVFGVALHATLAALGLPEI
jgi:hypothetical protein